MPDAPDGCGRPAVLGVGALVVLVAPPTFRANETVTAGAPPSTAELVEPVEALPPPASTTSAVDNTTASGPTAPAEADADQIDAEPAPTPAEPVSDGRLPDDATPAPEGVTLRLELAQSEVAAGGSVSGTMTLGNGSDTTLERHDDCAGRPRVAPHMTGQSALGTVPCTREGGPTIRIAPGETKVWNIQVMTMAMRDNQRVPIERGVYDVYAGLVKEPREPGERYAKWYAPPVRLRVV